jgi:hypothetical protein
MPTGQGWNTIQIKHFHSYLLTFSTKTYKLLPKPYSTDCIDYSINTEHISQQDCIRKCRIRESFIKCNSFPNETNLYEWEVESIAHNKMNPNNECIDKIHLKEICNNFCPHMDCIKHYIKPKLVGSGPTEDLSWRTTGIGISFLTEPKQIYEYKPKMETIEFLCYIASILSLWFGFSIISLDDWFNKLFLWFKFLSFAKINVFKVKTKILLKKPRINAIIKL